jgi:hypothetical protein
MGHGVYQKIKTVILFAARCRFASDGIFDRFQAFLFFFPDT